VTYSCSRNTESERHASLSGPTDFGVVFLFSLPSSPSSKFLRNIRSMNDILLKVVFAGGMGEEELPFRSNKQHKNNEKVCAFVMNDGGVVQGGNKGR